MRRTQELTGISKVYADYVEMLDNEALDVVIFCPENARHGEVAEAIATRGVHMVTEKPMSSTLQDGLRMVRAAEANNVSLAINWPSTWRPGTRQLKVLVDQGVIGAVSRHGLVRGESDRQAAVPDRGKHGGGRLVAPGVAQK